MKKILIKGLVGAMLLGGAASCSDDYLQVDPDSVIDTSMITASVDGAQMAFNGICRSMYYPWTDFGGNMFPNGEPYFQMLGDVMGQDYYSYMWSNRTGPNYRLVSIAMQDAWMTTNPWRYYYGIIGQCNNILVGIDHASGDAKKRDFVKAQTLTIRAHCYTKLMMFFGPRWIDSRNGELKSIVLRLTPGTGDSPLVTVNKVRESIYNDLTTAIGLFESSNVSRKLGWEPDVNVAHGVYARAALWFNDFDQAASHAADARKGHPVMTADQYMEGFVEHNDEWMWYTPADLQLYYWQFGSVYACNAGYPVEWGFGAGSINYDLYRKATPGDIRKELFFTPDKCKYIPLGEAVFFNNKYVSPATMDCSSLNDQMKINITGYKENRAKSLSESIDVATCPAYDKVGGSGGIIMPFGAQYKFWSTDKYGTSEFPYMRGAEMCLIEAEAAYEAGDVTKARACLKELMAKRVEGYDCESLTGEALRDEIRLQRRMELWGEGFNFIDLKRWNLPIVRKPWVQGDRTSNNIPAPDALEFQPNEKNGFRLAVPRAESQYNKAVVISELEYNE